MDLYGHVIDGERVESLSGDRFESVDPTAGEAWAIAALGSPSDVARAVASAHNAFGGDWRRLSPTRRGRLMMRFADEIANHADEIATLEARDNGKLLRELSAQARAVPDWFYYYGGLADKIEGSVIPLDRTTTLNYTQHEPLGVVGVITPWNSPTLLASMAIAPALAAGNTVVLKPSEVTPASAVVLAQLALDAGIPPGVVNVVNGDGRAGRALSEDEGVAKVVFTGGTAAGRAVAAATGSRLGRSLLELGGKSANVVFEDANIDAAVAGVLAGIFAAGGQTCIAGSRALVHRSIHDSFAATLAQRAREIRIGNPFDPATQMGPVASAAQLSRIETMVAGAVDRGADVLAGAARATVPGFENGFFYAPTVLTALPNDDQIVQEEVFGPVLTIQPFDDEEEAVELANSTRFGLAAGVWTENVKRAHRVAQRLEAGTVWINLYRAITFNSPFGGYKDSGTGRENGIGAIYEFLQTKSVWCELGDEIQDPFIMRV